jgi:D-alanyl-D-alanine carboxypeptidase
MDFFDYVFGNINNEKYKYPNYIIPVNYSNLKEKNDYTKSMTLNKLLEKNSNVLGIKTGITPKAGGCLATFYKIDEQNYAYIIVLGCNSTEARFKDTQIIIDYISDENNIF